MRLDSAFYPAINEPRRSGQLALDDLHTMYWEEFGSPEGVPILVLHGGPGGSIRPYYRQLIDPQVFRGILFDQRGCGKSTPFGELRNNTTQHLVEDIERLRRHLGIQRWLVLGGSWGSTLALAYAERYGESCIGLIVTGVFLARPDDIWWWWEGTRFIFPEVWAEMRDFLPSGERNRIKENYVRRILDPDPEIHGPAATALMSYEALVLDVWPNAEFVANLESDPNAIIMGRLFAKYSKHDFFLDTNQLLANSGKLKKVSGHIIVGRFDICTPPAGAFDLKQAWPGAHLSVVPVAGHRWNDERLGAAVIRAVNSYAR